MAWLKEQINHCQITCTFAEWAMAVHHSAVEEGSTLSQGYRDGYFRVTDEQARRRLAHKASAQKTPEKPIRHVQVTWVAKPAQF